jgi:DNA-binding SARP family transcriptional activator/tetratricopeptide (TPR) repeat protein
MSVRALRDIENDRVVRPHLASVEALADLLVQEHSARQDLIDALGRGPSASPLSVNILGPLTVQRGGVSVELVQPMQRNLLGLLAMHVGTPVGRDQIVDSLWGDAPPKTVRSLIHDHVGRLRSLLDPRRERGKASTLIRHSASGYLLDERACTVDVSSFTTSVATGTEAHEAGDDGRAFDLLSGALDVWRGHVLADGAERIRAHPVAVSLNQRRVEAAIVASDVALALGRNTAVIRWLGPLTELAPLHEGLHVRLLLALAADGDQAAALAHFHTVRERLADELGVEPTVALRDAYLQVLRQEPVAAAPSGSTRRPEVDVPAALPIKPAQLPPDISTFVGRDDVLDRLEAAVTGGGTTVRILAITGAAGVGKTALAIHWARQVRDRFPDGQLYLNLHGYSDVSSCRPEAALAVLLSGLGVLPDRLPADADSLGALYRSVTADRKLLVVLDNARAAEQVRPLLPTGRECVVIVTSRAALAGLVARDGALPFPLSELAIPEAQALLTELLGVDRVVADPDATAELGVLCGHLPLALRIAASRVSSTSSLSIRQLVERMHAPDRLTTLEVIGDRATGVRDVFSLSYAAIDDRARRLFRRMALVAGGDVTASHAAALLDLPAAESQGVLDQLEGEHLLSRTSTDRYAMHELLRLYAIELLRTHDRPDDREAARRRLYEWYASSAAAAARIVYPQKVLLADGCADDRAESFAGRAEAMAWLEAERANLVGAVVASAEHGNARLGWMLADTLRGYFWLSLHFADWMEVATTALATAEREGDTRAVAAARLSRGDLNRRIGKRSLAVRDYMHAVLEARRAGWCGLTAVALGSLGRLYRQAGKLDRSVRLQQAALALRGPAYATNLGNLGLTYRTMGRLDDAFDCYSEALALHRAAGSPTGEAVALANLGETMHAMGRLEDASDRLTTALAMQRSLGDRGNEATTLRLLAAVDRDIGRHEDALAHGASALELARSTNQETAVASTLNLLGSVHQLLGAHTVALEYHERAARMGDQAGERYAVPVALLGMAELHRSLGTTGLAQQYADMALRASKRHGYALLASQARAYSDPGRSAG